MGDLKRRGVFDGEKSASKRRRTATPVKMEESEEVEMPVADAVVEDVNETPAKPTNEIAFPRKGLHRRRTSTGSRFTEELDRPTTAYSTTTVVKMELPITHEEQQESSSEEIAVSGSEKDRKEPLKGAMKFVGQAVKSGLKRTGSTAGGSVRGKGTGPGMMRQSTLTFAKVI